MHLLGSPVTENAVLFRAKFGLVEPHPVEALCLRLGVRAHTLLLEETPTRVRQDGSSKTSHEVVRVELQHRQARSPLALALVLRIVHQVRAPALRAPSRKSKG